jgi:hypothetical protein
MAQHVRVHRKRHSRGRIDARHDLANPAVVIGVPLFVINT